MASGGEGYGEPPAGDYLQTVYRFWLVGHQLAHGDQPWRDPYSFQPLVSPETLLGGWPFGFLYWPLGALFGPVVAWNLLLLGTIVAAGLVTYLWLRALELGEWAAAIGGLAFAVAPYRLAQSASGHLLGWTALLVPLALLGIERAQAAGTRRRADAWGAVTAASLISIAVSGQLHLALGAIPFVLAYVLVRRGRIPLLWTAGGVLAAMAVGLAVRYTLIAGSTEDQGRSLAEVRKFQAEWPDLVDRWHRAASEEFVYVGWLTPVLALAGLVFLWKQRRWLAVLFGLSALVPILLSLGTNLPIYSPLWHALPPLRFPRVPERFMPIANLAFAALVAFAAAELIRRAGRRGTAVAAALLVLVALDLGAKTVSPAAADPDNAAYAALSSPGRGGRILELPLFDPGIHYGSVYDYYELQAKRERPQGYNTLAPEAAYAFAFTYDRISCGVWKPGDEQALEGLGVTSVLLHVGVYRQSRDATAWFASHALMEHGWAAAEQGGAVTLFTRSTASRGPTVPEPPRTQPAFCLGWRDGVTTQLESPFWLYGTGPFTLTFSAGEPTHAALSAEGRVVWDERVEGEAVAHLSFGDDRWHAVILDASRSGLALSVEG
jgi:6-pyruvoyl-tetrahydropterin synthase related domain